MGFPQNSVIYESFQRSNRYIPNWRISVKPLHSGPIPSVKPLHVQVVLIK